MIALFIVGAYTVFEVLRLIWIIRRNRKAIRKAREKAELEIEQAKQELQELKEQDPPWTVIRNEL